MIPIDFKERNFIFTKPQDMTDEECMDLPVWKGNMNYGDLATFPSVVSCWKFSKEDLEEIQKTGVIWLSVTGFGTPPVALFTEHPFKNETR